MAVHGVCVPLAWFSCNKYLLTSMMELSRFDWLVVELSPKYLLRDSPIMGQKMNLDDGHVSCRNVLGPSEMC